MYLVIMKYLLTKHAIKEMELRGISVDMVKQILENPLQIVEEYGNKKAYQSIIDNNAEKKYLYRVIVDDSVEPLKVITVYKTSKIDKYWRE